MPCAHCREIAPPGFWLCRACARELTWPLRVDLWTAQSRAHFPDLYPLGPHRLQQAQLNALSHLRQHSTAFLL